MISPFVSSPTTKETNNNTMAEPVATATSAAAQDNFQTPDRSSLPSRNHRHLRSGATATAHFEEKKEGDAAESTKLRPKAATVTPSDVLTRKEKEAAEEEKVRNGEESAAADKESSDTKKKNKRGLVSRRGGRCGSPGRGATSPPTDAAHAAAAAVLEFKTFRSPERKQRDENDTEPSLCSTASGDAKATAAAAKKEQDNAAKKANNDENNTSSKKPTSIQYDAADKADSASPLKDDAAAATKKSSGKTEGAPKKGTVTFSPVPPPSAADRVSKFARKCRCFISMLHHF